MGDIDIMNDNELRKKKNFDYLIKSTIMLKLYDIEILKLEYNRI